jgi:hypothetical protein
MPKREMSLITSRREAKKRCSGDAAVFRRSVVKSWDGLNVGNQIGNGKCDDPEIVLSPDTGGAVRAGVTP